MWKKYEISFWNHHMLINDCSGNLNKRIIKARSFEEAKRKAENNKHWKNGEGSIRIKDIQLIFE